MTPSKIIPESKQKNKPVNPTPVLTPEIIPETLRPLLNSPKPAFNSVPRPESYMNKIQSQRLKSRLVPRPTINQKNWPPLTGFQNNQKEIPGNPPVPGCCNPDCKNFPAFNVNGNPKVSFLPVDFYHCLVNCDEVSLFFDCEEFWLVDCLCEFLDCFPDCCVADF